MAECLVTMQKAGILIFRDVVIKNTTEGGKGDHFRDSAEMNLLKALVLYVDLGYPPENRNIGQVFQSAIIKQITAKDEIDLELPGQKPCAYFCITSDQDDTFDFPSSLFLSFVFIKLVRYADKNCEGGKLSVPVHVLGEEICACGVIPELSRKISLIRSRNVSMSLVFQNLAGLQNRYPYNQWQELLGNCDVQLFWGCTDALTAEFISERSGVASVAVSSQAKQLGTWRISDYTPEYRETNGVGKRNLLTPDEVLRLPLEKALIIIRGHKLLQVDKYDYSLRPGGSPRRA